MYGQSFSLANAQENGLNAPAYGGGEAGDFTRARGFLSYYEVTIKAIISNSQISNKKFNITKSSAKIIRKYACITFTISAYYCRFKIIENILDLP